MVSVLTAEEDDPANPEHFHSAGRILPRVDVRLRRDDDTIAKIGEIGRIEVRSPAMAQGYRNQLGLEAVAFRNGWYASGDLGRIDEDGYLHIFGRAADIEFIDGRMVSSTLIEDALCRLPEVRYAVVVVDQDRHAGKPQLSHGLVRRSTRRPAGVRLQSSSGRRWRHRCSCYRSGPFH